MEGSFLAKTRNSNMLDFRVEGGKKERKKDLMVCFFLIFDFNQIRYYVYGYVFMGRVLLLINLGEI